jgi:hypothetical protein
MKNRICFIILFTFFLFCSVKISHAAVWPISNSTSADNTDTIVSDYGPRVRNKGGEFHFGIDVKAQSPQPVHAIVNSTIKYIKLDTGTKGAGNYIETDKYRYLHLSKEAGNTKFENKRATDDQYYNVIIIYDGERATPQKVLSTENELGELPEFKFDGLTEIIKSTNQISEGEVNAYSGSSGKVEPHLHFDKDHKAGGNPLSLLKGNYSSKKPYVRIKYPKNGDEIPYGTIRVEAEVVSCNNNDYSCGGNGNKL